jgi:micrococcal nuclease
MNIRTKFPWFYKFPTWGKIVFWLCFYPIIIGVLLWYGVKNKQLRNVLVGVWSSFFVIIYISFAFTSILQSQTRQVSQNKTSSNTQKSELENEVSKRLEAENKLKEEESKRIEAENSKKDLENKIAQAQVINTSYDVGNDLGSQDIQTSVKANLAIATLGSLTKDQKLFDVTSVVDGDTIKVSELGTLRLIGIDTPETKDPRKPVQCFGAEASKRASELLSGKKVYLEFDPANRIDKYGRTLAYVYREDGYFFNAEMVKDGYANSYTKYPHPKLEEFNVLAREAREKQKGLYSPDTCNGDTSQKAKNYTPAPNQPATKITTTQPNLNVTPVVLAPETVTTPVSNTTPTPNTDVYYANCDAVRAAGKAPIYSGQPGYRAGLDRDKNGIGCE